MVIKIRYGMIVLVFSIILSLFLLLILKDQVSWGSAGVSSEENIICLPIIMYHEVKTYNLGKDVISPYEFESDLKYLKENGYTPINMTDLVAYIYYDNELPEKPVIISFDDGYLNNYKYVLPLLEKYQMKIVFSIIGKNTDDFTRIPDDNIDYSHVTWEQLNEMIDSGYVEVQNHTYDLHHMKNGRVGCMQKTGESYSEYQQLLTEDICGLQEKILYETGVLPNTFTYPYGRYNDNTDQILKDLGFKASLSCDYGINLITKDPDVLFGLKRICRAHGQNIGKIIKEGMETLRFIENAST